MLQMHKQVPIGLKYFINYVSCNYAIYINSNVFYRASGLFDGGKIPG